MNGSDYHGGNSLFTHGRVTQRFIRLFARWCAAASVGFVLLVTAIETGQGQEFVISDLPPDDQLERDVVPGDIDTEPLIADEADSKPFGTQDVVEPQRNYSTNDSGVRWAASVDALMLWQGAVPSVPVFVGAGGETVLNANQVSPAMAAGPRFCLVRRLGETYSIEGNYFNVQSSNANGGLQSTGESFKLATVPTFDDIESATFTTAGQIQSAELNWRRWNRGSFTWLAGFRWVEWNQQLATNYVYANELQSGTGYFRTNTGNDLYGGQIGLDVQLWNRGQGVRVSAVGKTGLFYNASAYQRSTAGFTDSTGNVSLGSFNATADQTAFVNELGVNASLRLTKWLSWRAGYTLFWLSGVAMAPNQLPLTDFGSGVATINTEGSVLLHGVTTGLEARW